jgi:hypothetical protein
MYAIRRGLGIMGPLYTCANGSQVAVASMCPELAAPVPAPGIVWTDCPDGSTVPANIGCPSYGQTISDFIGANPGTVGIGVAVLFGVILMAKADR